MPVSDALRRLSEDSSFWAAYLTGAAWPGTDADTRAAELRVSFPVAGGYGLVLDLDLAGGGAHTLGLRPPTASDPVHLAGTGPERPAAPVLRWAELDVIGRVLALDDPTLPHPGLPVALLTPFTAPSGVTGDGADTLLRGAYRSLRRAVTPVGPVLPEQAPLPLFAAARWWPQPEQPSDRVLSEHDVTGYLAAHTDAVALPRHGPRFPAPDLAELVRRARCRLDRLREASWYGPAGALPLARRICVGGDLAAVPALAAALTAAGCDHPTVLDALTGPVVAAEAGWMVETLAGVEPGTLLARLAATEPVAGGHPGARDGGY